MSCIGCEEYAKRITNINQDDILKDRFFSLTGIPILRDCFICDKCNKKLQQAFQFKTQCLVIYTKSNFSKENPLYEENPLEEADPSEEGFEDEKGGIAFIDIKEEYNMESIITEDSGELEGYMEDREFMEDNVDVKEDQKLYKKPKEQQLNCSTGKIEVVVKPRRTHTPHQKLEIIKFAEIESNRSAMRKFHIDESCIRRWRSQKETIENIYHEQQTSNHFVSNRKPRICWPYLEKELKDWVVENKDRGILLKPYEIKAAAIEIAKRLNIPEFKGTSSFIFKFMQRNDITTPPPKKPKRNKGTNELLKLREFPVKSSFV